MTVIRLRAGRARRLPLGEWEPVASPPRRHHPHVYEINTRLWLRGLVGRTRRPVSLGSVPDEEWQRLRDLGIDYVWLMGVWEPSRASARLAADDPSRRREYDRALPGWRREDLLGSPYAVAAYRLNPLLGRPSDLYRLRDQLHRLGLRLLLDLVPNHTARDHPWVMAHPEYYVHGTPSAAAAHPDWCFEVGEGAARRLIAHGRDPHFAPWRDTAQVNAWHPGFRQAMIETVEEIAACCDGVRCDMAMLLLNEVFGRTWGAWVADAEPPTEFWSDLIGAVKTRHPEFLFMAEVYWDLEWRLQQLGFDCTYDKRLYDRLRETAASGVRAHLTAEAAYQRRSVRFLENHDEPRAVAAFGRERSLAAAAVVMTVPGVRLLHDGQLEGRRLRAPIQLARVLAEAPDQEARAFYERLLAFAGDPVLHNGTWTLLTVEAAWEGNGSYEALLAWCWTEGEQARLVVINYAGHLSQGRLRLPIAGEGAIELVDVLTGECYERQADAIRREGLYVALGPYGVHLFQLPWGE